MTDLFGDTITSPTVACHGLINKSHGFVEFWQTWPIGPRKVAKQQVLNKWATLDCASDATLIRLHVEWLKTQDDWLRDSGRFICAPLVYLNQQRWIDWEPIEIKVKPERHSELDKLDNDAKQRAMPSLETLAKIAQLRQRTAA